MSGKTNLGPHTPKGLDRSQVWDDRVLAAISRVPRHKFVLSEYHHAAYEDRALPIGQGQTISQPYIVALMTQEAGIKKGAKVLEVGTGSGYQAAVLAELGADVFSIEIKEELASRAALRLAELGYDGVIVKQGDGWQGWSEEAPFDVILVTASSPLLPPALLNQLADGGNMLIPLEQERGEVEQLTLIQREGENFITKEIAPVRFVPLTGKGRVAVNEGGAAKKDQK